tara:strand:+ start:177 stop:1529 length:1353 start_codon:yes stop_codon:yes gene_type:complete
MRVSSGRYSSGQFRCQTCEIFLEIGGTNDGQGLFCKCCHFRVRTKPRNKIYKQKFREKKLVDPQTEKEIDPETANEIKKELAELRAQLETQKKSKKKATKAKEKNSDGLTKTYIELKEFIEEEMRTQANYQLVMLDELVSNKFRHKGQIAEAIAFWNNKDPSDFEELKFYMEKIPVYDVLIKHGIVRYASDTSSPISPVYRLNVELEEMEQTRIQELITNRLEIWNKEHGIPDNQFPNADTKNNVRWSSAWKKIPEVKQRNNYVDKDQTPEELKKKKFASIQKIGKKWDNEKILEEDDVEELKVDGRGMATKVCPRCKFKFFGFPHSENFQNRMEEYFGYRPRKFLSDEGKEIRIPQSWCRKCRRGGKSISNRDVEINRLENELKIKRQRQFNQSLDDNRLHAEAGPTAIEIEDSRKVILEQIKELSNRMQEIQNQMNALTKKLEETDEE